MKSLGFDVAPPVELFDNGNATNDQDMHIRKRMVGAALSLLTVTGSVAACGYTSSGGPVPVPDGPSVLSFDKVVHSWNLDGCLTDYVEDGGVPSASRPTDLCRSVDPINDSSARFYYLFARGAGARNWLAIVGTDTQGNYYWKVPGSREYMQKPNGQTGYLVDRQFVPEANDITDNVTLEFNTRALANVMSLQAKTYVSPTTPPTTPAQSPELSQSQAQVQRQTQQAQQEYQQLQQATNQAKLDQIYANEVQVRANYYDAWTDLPCAHLEDSSFCS